MSDNNLIPRNKLGLSRTKLEKRQIATKKRKERLLGDKQKRLRRYIFPEPFRIRQFVSYNFPQGPWTFLLRQDNKPGFAEVTFWPGEEDRLYKFLMEQNKSEDSSIFFAVKQQALTRTIEKLEDCVVDPWFDILARHFRSISGEVLNADVHRILADLPDYNYRKGAHHRIKRIMNYLGWTRGQNGSRKACYTRGAARPLYLHYHPFDDKYVVSQVREAPWTKDAA